MKNKTVQMIKEKFDRIFPGGGDIRAYFAPGRVNLIGEHTDYNGGHVFPCALTIGTYAVVRKRTDKKINFYSVNFESLGVLEASLDRLVYDSSKSWINYPLAVIKTFIGRGYTVDSGMDFMVFGNIPNAAGLSSSASLEVLTGFALKDMFSFDRVNMIELALIGQEAENKFIGVSCGIMDQFAIAMAKEGHAIFLNTATLQYSYAPLCLGDVKIVIINTNKKRGLGDSKYNERCKECTQVLSELEKFEYLESLGSLTPQKFEEGKKFISNETLKKRARHVVYENQRTKDAVQALRRNDLLTFGALMKQSHTSLRDDYEVTGIELDTIVKQALKQKGVIGARMTGAGFGGCAVALVKEAYIGAFKENIAAAYTKVTGLHPDFYVVEPGGGPQRLL